MVDLIKLSDLFHIEYGNQLDKNKLVECDEGVNFVSRTSSNLGVDTKIEPIPDVEPYEAGLITATLGGTYLLSSFIQPERFYTGQNIKVLRPLKPMSFNEMIFYCLAISKNRFRYTSHGREANKTFDNILVPAFEALPDWVGKNPFYQKMLAKIPKFSASSEKFDSGRIGEKRVKLSELFDVVYGHNLELNSLTRCDHGVNFVSRTAENNGVSARVKPIDGLAPTEAGVLTVAGGGSVLETFLQTEPFYSGRDLYYLRPKTHMTLEQKLFFCVCIRENRFRYNYGRQANKTLRDLMIPAISEIPVWSDNAYGDILKNWTAQGSIS
jgi:Type I restriction modification DNA specificity domain